MTLEQKIEELEIYEKALKEHYPSRTEFERLQIAISLMNLETTGQIETYLTKKGL